MFFFSNHVISFGVTRFPPQKHLDDEIRFEIFFFVSKHTPGTCDECLWSVRGNSPSSEGRDAQINNIQKKKKTFDVAININGIKQASVGFLFFRYSIASDSVCNKKKAIINWFMLIATETLRSRVDIKVGTQDVCNCMYYVALNVAVFCNKLPLATKGSTVFGFL